MHAAAIEPTLASRREALADLCQAFGVEQLDVFGSAAQGRFDPGRSDYDFIVRFLPRPEVSVARRYLAFNQALQQLLGRPVDLMTDHPIANPWLHQSVQASRVPLYVATPAQVSA